MEYIKLVPKLSSNKSSDGFVTITTSSNIGSMEGYRAFNYSNTDNGDCWHANNSKISWLQMTFSKKVNVLGYEFTSRYDTPYMTNFTLQYSNDGITWINIHSFHQDYSNNKFYKFIFNKSCSAKYFRLYGVSDSDGGASMYVTCGEFNLYTTKSTYLVYKNNRYYNTDDKYFIDNNCIPLPIDNITSNDIDLYGTALNEIYDKIDRFNPLNIIYKGSN